MSKLLTLELTQVEETKMRVLDAKDLAYRQLEVAQRAFLRRAKQLADNVIERAFLEKEDSNPGSVGRIAAETAAGAFNLAKDLETVFAIPANAEKGKK